MFDFHSKESSEEDLESGSINILKFLFFFFLLIYKTEVDLKSDFFFKLLIYL